VADGVQYRTWAPGKVTVEAVIFDAEGGVKRTVSLGQEAEGYFGGLDSQGRAGDRYQYRLDGAEWPDPASRFNPDGIHGAAEVIDPADFIWHDQAWSAPPISDLIIYELHIGTFTPEGTFGAAIDKLDHLVALGVTALEIMPVADFPGKRNWGYDGVLLYAPARVYGEPNDFRALVDAAHQRRLAVILDVVYNHLGPDGNYLGNYSDAYFNPAHKTPWGDAFNFAVPSVRNFFLENPIYWRREFHIDGFRLDATHAIVDTSEEHILAEIASSIHSLGGFIMAEDERNDAQLLRAARQGGIGLDAVWSDDFHHVVRVMLTGAREGYYQPYQGTIDELAATLDHGWLFEGAERARRERGQLAEAATLHPEQFIFCIANHDQIGNQAFGQRLHEIISPAAFRAASALLCVLPYTPLILMGQEWGASSPFQYFTDHAHHLGRLVTEGRRQEFSGFAAFGDPVARAKIPDPQNEETFLRSKLRWEEIAEEEHAGVLRLYREILKLRRRLPVLRNRSREGYQVLEPIDGIIRLLFGKSEGAQCLVLADLVGGHSMPRLDEGQDWQSLFSSNEKRFGGNDEPPFSQPEVRVLETV
jgi:malto-oligosyltrehalose trehalohydrolase